MKLVLPILGLLLVSFTAQASYWRCDGEKLTAGFIGLGSRTLNASTTGSSTGAYQASVKKEGVVFDGKGTALKNVAAVTGKDTWGNMITLDLESGSISIIDSDGKVLKSDRKMTCAYSDGE